jgi:hypothetical protein
LRIRRYEKRVRLPELQPDSVIFLICRPIVLAVFPSQTYNNESV